MDLVSLAAAVATASAPAAQPYAAHVAEAARRFDLPEAWIWAVLRAESAGRPWAVSPKGAMGLMQLMPATYAELRVRHGLGPDPFQPRDNILAGAAYLRQMFDLYGAPGFLAAYNAGPGRMDAHLAGRPLPAETRAYVAGLAPRLGLSGSSPPQVRPGTAPLFAVRTMIANPPTAPAWGAGGMFVPLAAAHVQD
ncbi:MAG: lytic transglycosylase domain-containing protein [Phenylobacterium sp.]|uniref:lytic transglycosylase domain-containing protein n=1 Tax=Phenylobacterium sp. TaxID=1871053 RepID=UPI002736EC32|nr:lytic transglycosylase domain-containing protein [Phenylobacterium sp.]MDP3746657.1 lytic transglycosylase domain-containing protein [Phenylobacterium sp.]